MQRISVSAIHTGLNPREHFDPEQIKELAQSIKEHGLLQPISVRQHEGSFQLIAGERRFRAMQSLGEKTVPAIVHNVNDQQARELALIENINRVDMRPAETGKAYQGLLDSGLSVKDISAKTGKSDASIQQYLSVVQLPQHLQALVDNGRLPLGVVRELTKLSSKGQENAAERIVSQDLGVRSARSLIKAMQAQEAQISMFPSVSRTLSLAETDARGRYDTAISELTARLHSLDDETMAHTANAVESPFKESQRLNLMIQQLRHMQDLLNQAGHSRSLQSA